MPTITKILYSRFWKQQHRQGVSAAQHATAIHLAEVRSWVILGVCGICCLTMLQFCAILSDFSKLHFKVIKHQCNKNYKPAALVMESAESGILEFYSTYIGLCLLLTTV